MLPRALSSGDNALWLTYVRDAKVVRLGGDPRDLMADAPEPPPPPAQPEPKPTITTAAPAKARPHEVAIGLPPGGLDRSTWSRLKNGQMPVQRRVDLHGQTVQEAFDTFVRAILYAAEAGERCVEVITGRGVNSGGAIRHEFPHWVNNRQVRRFILAASHPSPTNSGSVLVLLRRKRTARRESER